MRETPVTVTAGCARAIAAGTKTMLRQVAREPEQPCPLGGPRDRLWVRSPEAGASVLSVEIAGIRLERLQNIPDDDLEAEGGLWREFHQSPKAPREAFGAWWDSVHSRPGTKWDDNPPVWVVTFARV